MSVYSVIHTTKAYTVASYNYGYERRIKQYNFLICFAGNQNYYTVAELVARFARLSAAQQRIVLTVRRKYGI